MGGLHAMRNKGWWALSLLLCLSGVAWGQATAVVSATADLNGPSGPNSAYDHQDAIYDWRGEVSLREAMTYGNANRVKVGRRVSQTVNSSGAGRAWGGAQMSVTSPFSAIDVGGGNWQWVRLGNTAPVAGVPPPQGAPYFTPLPNWTQGGTPGNQTANDPSTSTNPNNISRVLVFGDNSGYGNAHVYNQPTDNTVHNGVIINGNAIRFQNFGFNIPSGSTITGITVRLWRYADDGPTNPGQNTYVRDRTVQLLRAGNNSGNNNAKANTDWDRVAGGPPVLSSYPGGGPDLWGTSWSPADINDPTFGVEVATTARYDGVAGSNNANVSDRYENWGIIDLVEVRVFISPAPQLSALIKADDTQRIQSNLTGAGLGGDVTQELQMLDWRYDQPTKLIPDDARITGVAFQVVRSAGAAGSVRDEHVKLIRPDFGTPGAVIHSTTDEPAGGTYPINEPSGYEANQTYGNRNDTWGFADLKGADVNDPRFGIGFTSRNLAGGAVTASVNYAEMSIWWEDPLAGTQYIHNYLTITLDGTKSVFVYYPTPLAPTPLPTIVRDHLTIDGEINGDGQPDLTINFGILAQNPAPTGVLTKTRTDTWTRAGLQVGNTATRVQDVLIEGVRLAGASTSGSSAWVPAVWLANGNNIRVANTDASNTGIGVLTSVTTPDKCYIGSQTAGSNCNITNNVNAGIYTVGDGQTLVQQSNLTDNGTSPTGLDPYSANVVLAGAGDNVIGGTASTAGNTIQRNPGTAITAIAGTGFGITVPGTGQNTIVNNHIQNHFAPGIWIASTNVLPIRADANGARTRPYPTIVGGSATNSGNTITGNGAAPANNSLFPNHSGIWVNGWAGDDSESPNSSRYAGEYNLVQGNTISGNGGAGIFLEGPGKTRVGGVATTASNTITANGSLNGANGLEQSGIEIRSTGNHYGDRLHALNPNNPLEVFANIVENNNINTNLHGINIVGTDDNLVGGAQTASRNYLINNTSDGLRIQGSGNTRVSGNYIGVAADGGNASNNVNGIEITAGAGGANQIGGTSSAERNIISFNGTNGISILGNGANRVIGNYIGLNPAGSGGAGNGGNGVAITQQATGVNVIGGAQPGERNFIGANGQFGVSVEGDGTGTTNVIKGNFVGLGDGGANAPASVGNRSGGILVNATAAQTIGGSVLGEGNFISANQPDDSTADGVELSGKGDHNVIGNAIGGRPNSTNGWPATGGVGIGGDVFHNGGSGVLIATSSIGKILVGGVGTNDGNTIIANNQHGVNIAGTGVVRVYNNRIGSGPDNSGTFQRAANALDGVLVTGAGDNRIGGVNPNQGNIIAGNNRNGVNVPAPGNNIVAGNKIGVGDTGLVAIGNGSGGSTTALPAAANNNGVTVTGTGTNLVTFNTISGNQNAGVFFSASGILTLSRNYIGTNEVISGATRSATGALPNGTHGVYLPNGHTGQLQLGDGSVLYQNVIGGNTLDGVHIEGGQINNVDGNLIGVRSDATGAIGNGGNGVYVDNFVQPQNGHSSTTEFLAGAVSWGNAIHGNMICGSAGTAPGVAGNGIYLRSGSLVVYNNRIGVTPTTVVGNKANGILVDDKNLVVNRENVVIGAYPEPANTMSGATLNIIAGNGTGAAGDGIRLLNAGGNTTTSYLDDVLIRNNYIGYAPGLANAGNKGNGVYVDTAVNGRIVLGVAVNAGNSSPIMPANAGAAAAVRNVISGNGGLGVLYKAQFMTAAPPAATNAPILYNNYIGTTNTGLAAAPNVGGGIQIDVNDASRDVRIGDVYNGNGRATLASSNVISGNTGPGIEFHSPARGYVYGNYIGVGADGHTVVGNGAEGVIIKVGPTGRVDVGGADGTHRLRNVFVGNGTGATAGVPRFAVSVQTGLVPVKDNIFGYGEDQSLRSALTNAVLGNPGGGVLFSSGSVSGTLLDTGGTAVAGSGSAGGQPGVQFDMPFTYTQTNLPVIYGGGPGIQIGSVKPIGLDNCPTRHNAGPGIKITATDTSSVTVQNASHVTFNAGGGISSVGTGPLTVANSNIENNTGGGGISALGSQVITLSTAPVTNNTGGTGIKTTGAGAGSLTMTASPVSKSDAGGISLTGTGVVHLTNSSIHDNAGGAGLAASAASVITLDTSEVKANTGGTGIVTTGTGAGSLGLNTSPVHGSTAGGIRLAGTGAVTLTDSSVHDNTGGPGLQASGDSAIHLTNSPVASNTGGTGIRTAGGGTGSLLLDTSQVFGSTGGGISVTGTGAVTLNTSPVHNNGGGGGITASAASTVVLNASPVTANTGGAGLTTLGTGAGAVTLTNSAVATNQGGGGVSLLGTGAVRLDTSPVTGNLGGRGLKASAASAIVLISSPVTGNKGGGGIITVGTGPGSISLTNSAVTSNQNGPGVMHAGSGDIAANTSGITDNTPAGAAGSGGVSTSGNGKITLVGSTVNNNAGVGVQSTGTGAVTTDSQVDGNAGGGIFALGNVTITAGEVRGNSGDGVRITGAGTLTDTGFPIRANTGVGVVHSGSGAINLTNVQLDSNNGGGIAVSGSAAATVLNSLITQNGVPGGGQPGIKLTGSGVYRVQESTITNNRGDGVQLGVSAGQAATNAVIGIFNSDVFWANNSSDAGQSNPTSNTANLISGNTGFGINLLNGTGNRLRGNIVQDNAGGGIAGVQATPFFFNGLYKVSASTWRVSGKAPINTKVDIYEAKDPTATPSPAGHTGQVYKRLVTTAASTTGVFQADIPAADFTEPNDDLKLVTGQTIDPVTNNTTAYARNTGWANVTVIGGNGIQSTITVSPKQIQAENIPNRQQATVTVTLRDRLGTVLAGVPNVTIRVASPTSHGHITLIPAEGTLRTTDANGQLTAKVSATDRPGCVDQNVVFEAVVDGRTLPTVDPNEKLTLKLGNPEVQSATMVVDPVADPTTMPVADGTSPGTLRITIRDNSLSHCILTGFSKARVRVYQISGPTTPAATIGTPPTDSDSNGQLTVNVTALKAGTYVFGAWLDVNNDGTRAADGSEDLPAAQHQTIVFKPGPIDAVGSTVTADKATALADGGKTVTGGADAANTVTLSLTVVDSHSNAPVPNIPVSGISIVGQDVATNANLAPATGVVVQVLAPTDANGKTTAKVTSTHTGQIRFVSTVTFRSVATILSAKPVVTFSPVLDAATSTAVVSNSTVKADGTDSSTLTITVKDGSAAHNPVAGLPASAITITPNPATGVVIIGLTGTDAGGKATASIKGTMSTVPVTVTFTVGVAWPPVAQPAAGVQPVPPITLAQKPTVQFIVGVGAKITLVADRTVLRPNGTDAATLTATLLDALDHPVPGNTVVISVEDGRGVSVTQPNTTTNSVGQVTATVKATQRNVPGALIQAALVPAGGTPLKLAEITLTFRYPDPDPNKSTLTLIQDTPLLANNLAKVTGTITLRDNVSAAGDPIPGVDPSRITIDAFVRGTTNAAPGVTVNRPTVTTNAAGQTTFTTTSTQAGWVTFRVRVDKEDASARITLAQTADIEFLGFVVQTYSPGLHMMGVAVTPRDPRPSTVLANAAAFSLATWLGPQQTYLIFNAASSPAAPFAMLPGKGFWLQLQDYLTLSVVGDKVATDQPFPPAAQAPLALSQGWNMVGNPFPVPLNFSLNRINVYQNNALVGDLTTAAAQRLLDPYGWRWDPAQQYLLLLDPSAAASGNVSGQVQLGRAFWWRALAQNVGVRFQPPVAAREVTRAAGSSHEWLATIEATIDGGSAQAFLGAGQRALRAALPPDAPQPSVLKVELIDSAGRAASDVREGPFTTKQTWTMAVTAAKAGDVTLSWQGLSRAMPAKHRLYLIDPTTGKRIIMNSRASYNYTTTGGTRQFSVELDPHGVRNLSITDVQVTPGRSRAATPVAVTLTADAHISVTVKGLGGRTVRTFEADGQTGLNALSWDGKDASGRAVPAGNYLVEVTAFTDEGEMARQVVTVSVR